METVFNAAKRIVPKIALTDVFRRFFVGSAQCLRRAIVKFYKMPFKRSSGTYPHERCHTAIWERLSKPFPPKTGFLGSKSGMTRFKLRLFYP